MKVGPAEITSQCTPTVVIDGAAVTLGCAGTLKNTSKSNLIVDWQSGTPQGQQLGTMNHKTLKSGESVDIPAPPAGDEWYVDFLTLDEVGHAAEFMAVAAVGVGALAAYGGYKAYKNFVAPRFRDRMNRNVTILR